RAGRVAQADDAGPGAGQGVDPVQARRGAEPTRATGGGRPTRAGATRRRSDQPVEFQPDAGPGHQGAQPEAEQAPTAGRRSLEEAGQPGQGIPDNQATGGEGCDLLAADLLLGARSANHTTKYPRE